MLMRNHFYGQFARLTLLVLSVVSLMSLSACGGSNKNQENSAKKKSDDFVLKLWADTNSVDHVSVKPRFTIIFSQSVTGVNESSIRLYKSDNRDSPTPLLVSGSAKYYEFMPKANLDYDSRYFILLKLTQIKDGKGRPIHKPDLEFKIKTNKKPLQFNAWVGSNDSLIDIDAQSFADLSTNSELYSYRGSSYSDCDIANITSCLQGQKLLLNGQTIIDKALTLNQPAYYKLKEDGLVSTNSSEKEIQLPSSQSHEIVSFKNKLFFYALNSEPMLWSSENGLIWNKKQATADSKEPEIFSHQLQNMPVFQDKIWLISDFDEQQKNHVWSSIDGVAWKKEVVNAPFSPRGYHQSVVFKNKLWLIGGYGKEGKDKDKSDIWSSDDGIIWNPETKDAPFPTRLGHQVVVFKDRLWVIGGTPYSSEGFKKYYKDIWSSSDGKTWKQEVVNTPFSARIRHQVVVFKGKLWLIAGIGSKLKHDIWSSDDGITWKQKVAKTLFSARVGHQVAVFKDRLWLIGGQDTTYEKNDVWQSVDGIVWRKGYLGEIIRR